MVVCVDRSRSGVARLAGDAGRNADRCCAQFHCAALVGAGTVGSALPRPRSPASYRRPFLNGDNMAFSAALPTLARLSQRLLDEQWADAAFAARGIETARTMVGCVDLEPAVAPLLTQRAERFAVRNGPTHRPASTPRRPRCATPASARWELSGRCSPAASCLLCASTTAFPLRERPQPELGKHPPVLARIRRGRVREPRGRQARRASAARSPQAYRAAASVRWRPARL